jgi:exodeoxyribonuclease VII small subunit
MTQKQTYTTAITELENILKQLENTEEINMDEITSKLKRASELMEFCKKQLHMINQDLEKMIADLEK